MAHDLDVFARIKDGVIAEYPVYALHIKNRAHPQSWYTPVLFMKKPDFDEATQYLKETLEYAGSHVIAKYTVEPLSVDFILDKIFFPNGHDFTVGEEEVPASVTVADINPLVLKAISDSVAAEIGTRLNTFVQTKGYEDVRSAATYTASAIPSFKAEADRVISLRDQSYSALYVYLNDIMTGAKPIPKNLAEIETNLPALTWE